MIMVMPRTNPMETPMRLHVILKKEKEQMKLIHVIEGYSMNSPVTTETSDEPSVVVSGKLIPF